MQSFRQRFSDWLRKALEYSAIQHNRFTRFYKKWGQPNGEQWANYLKCHGGLYSIGEHCSIQTNVTITDPAHTRLGNNVRLSGCTLFGHDGSVNMLKRAYGVTLDCVGKVDIRDNVFIGHQAIVLPGVTIGPNSIVAAGSVVTRNVSEGTVVAGIPARVVATLEEHLHKLQEETNLLPWRDHLPSNPLDCSSASPQLTAMRQAHFFRESLE